MKRSTLLVDAFVLVVWIAAGAAWPAESGSLTLGSGTGLPGRELKLPIYLNLAGEPALERIVAIVDYPAALTYSGAEVAKDVLANGVAIEAKELAVPARGKMRRVEVTVHAGKGKPLPAGMIGSLAFNVDPKASAQMASLPVTEARGYAKGSEAPVKLRADAGNVAIYEPGTEPAPLVSCFFFTH